MRRKSLISVISKAFSKSSKKESTSTVKNNSSSSNEGYVYTSYGKYTISEYSIIEEAFKYANLGDIEAVENIINSTSKLFQPINLHFLYNKLQEVLYKKREDPRFLQLAKEVCMKDYELLTSGKFLPSSNIQFPCINRLIIICEKTNDLTTAIEVAQFAVDNNLLGNYRYKLEQLRHKTSIDSNVPKPKRIKEILNEEGLCEREVKLIELLKQEVSNRGLNVNINYYTKSGGILEIRFDGAFIAQVKIKNNSDEYFERTVNQINDWINSYIKFQNYQQKLLNKIRQN